MTGIKQLPFYANRPNELSRDLPLALRQYARALQLTAAETHS